MTLIAVLALAGLASDFDQSHARFTRVLKARVKDGWVDYAGLRKDRTDLAGYLKTLESVKKRDFHAWTNPQKIAFWINAYNAYTLKLIIDHRPVKSIKDLGGFFTSVFGKDFIPLHNLFDEEVDLNTLEHDTLRKKFDEPRIHFALVCASKSCPQLRPEAYRAEILDAQLDDQARIFLNDRTKNRYDAATRTLYLSKIFDWFDGDFEKANGTVRDYVAPYLEIPKNARIRHLPYDWSLNGK